MRRQLILPILIFFHLFLLFKSSFTVWPEMILYPYLMNHGFLLFKDIINPYFPLLPFVLNQIFTIFGLSIFNLKLITYIIIVCSDVIVFLSAYVLSKNIKRSLWVLAVYIFLQVSFGGNGLWFELIIAPFLTYGLVTVFLNPNKKLEIFLSGLAIATSVLIKQNAVLFYFPIALLMIQKKQLKNLPYLLLPGLILGLITAAYLNKLGILSDFYFWAVQLPLSYPSQPGFVLLPTRKQYLLMVFLLFPMLLILSQKLKIYEKIYWILSFLIALSFAFPRYENFHLQVLIPLSAIFSSRIMGKKFIFFVILVGLIFVLSFPKIWDREDRFSDIKTLSLAEKIQGFDSVYLLNSPDLAYFFANKLPSKPWAINFPWYFEQEGFEDRFISGLNNSKVRYIVIGEQLGGGKYDLGNYLPEKTITFVYSNFNFEEKFNDFYIWKRK